MSLPQADPIRIDKTAEIFKEQALRSEEESRYEELSPEWRSDLLSPEGWNGVLDTYAVTMKVAVALTDSNGRLLGQCHNPQAIWQMTRGAKQDALDGCPFCLAPPESCSAVKIALRTGHVVRVEDRAGLSHLAVPLSLGGQQLGALVAGQVFSHYPEPLSLQRAARAFGVSPLQLWRIAVQQVPMTRTTLTLNGNLLL